MRLANGYTVDPRHQEHQRPIRASCWMPPRSFGDASNVSTMRELGDRW